MINQVTTKMSLETLHLVVIQQLQLQEPSTQLIVCLLSFLGLLEMTQKKLLLHVLLSLQQYLAKLTVVTMSQLLCSKTEQSLAMVFEDMTLQVQERALTCMLLTSMRSTTMQETLVGYVLM
jgi:hypothetical protein